ncbi:universal stress protein [Natronomonas salsuginis]|jgi:nucleotide-binding universal stress UspA family protein|uniref:Universal stress protein n=1 Tax=Natronomonas salsuginis TaxID=2217661 RepID=A0A4V5ZP08_9EURY|nr:universal stress protein [Natronomonas salsuginis]TKR25983.1 universal stress protein [Natronomonas salsuginis]
MHEKPTILLPVRILEGESLPEGTGKLLSNVRVLLLGYHVVPEQTAPGQMQMQFEDRAQDRLAELESALESAGATVETRLVFTHEGQKTIDRMIYEHGCLAVLVPDMVRDLDDVLVPIRGTVGVDRLVRVVTGLFADTDASITLFHVAEPDETDEDARTLLDGVADRLTDVGIDEERIRLTIRRGDGALDSITEAAESADAIVMGETDPSIATFVFGMPAEKVADRFVGPVFIVQRERPDGIERD